MMAATIKEMNETNEKLVFVNDGLVENRKNGIQKEQELEIINS
jgi:hypothetical protein